MEIIQYQHLFIYLLSYLFIYLFTNLFIWYIISIQFPCSVKSLSPDKFSTSEPLSWDVFLTLHYDIINNRNEEIQAKNVIIYCWQNATTFACFDIRHVAILLS